MPELPEVECVGRGVERGCVGRRVTAVRRGEHDVVVNDAAATPGLLVGDRVARVVRHGKQLAILGERGEAACVHLGMSGALTVEPAGRPARPHTHVTWICVGGIELRFRDPRRFGGVWAFTTEADLWARRWSKLGPDALVIGPATLGRRLAGRRTALKAALLDQATLAGLGNIYVDELLYAASLSPLRPAGSLSPGELRSLVRRMRTLLGGAIAAGGSTLRDYVDAAGARGGYQARHRVYGREGRRCRRRGCGRKIQRTVLAGRGTFTCPGCQALEPKME